MMLTAVKEIDECINKLENADNISKNKIENELVSLGNDAIPQLVEQLQIVKGSVRGIVAMILIRIGESAISYLQDAAKSNKDFEWIANYVITEINGTAA